jgi:hypothetical protein
MSKSPIYSDFWLEQETYSDYLSPSSDNTDEAFSIDLIQLASVRRILSNYVDILTGTNVPVYFKAIGDSYNVGGKEIYITTAIKRRKDFDQAVGLALHEAAHTVLTDFSLAKSIPFSAPKAIWDFGRKNNIRKPTLERFLKTMFNLVEDWYIDDWVMRRVPGYMGYYEASYNVCFNTPIIDEILLGNEFRHPSLASYEFRIINFCNPLTDLMALPGLLEVANEVSISTISRLNSTKKRILTAYKVCEIVMRNVQKVVDTSATSSGKSSSRGNTPADSTQPGNSPNKGKINVDDFFKEPSKANESKESKSETDRTVQDLADTLGSRPKAIDDENKSVASQTGKNPDKELSKEVKKAVESQMQYVHGNTAKIELNKHQKTMLDLIERHGIVLVYVPVAIEGNDTALRVGCIVVKKLSMELITAGQEVFPLANFWKDGEGDTQPDPGTSKAVLDGIKLGSKLGHKLVVRREINLNKDIRRRRGKVNRRLLYSAGFDAEDFFEKVHILKYNKGSLHITVDASTSMVGKKWLETMTMCVAICKATSMVDNIHVTVSFRATKTAKGVEMPYIVLAYDSKVDKFSKVKNLFKFLQPCGCTPEGLAFGAIMDIFTQAVPDEEDRYFLNISDGEPYFNMVSPLTNQRFTYADGNGVEHTRNQVNKIRRNGIHILSYYIQDGEYKPLGISEGHNTKKNFQIMYGRDARYIKSDSVIELAKTINQLFLKSQ